MSVPALPSWDGNVAAARDLQRRLAAEVRIEDDFPRPLRTLAGFDVGFEENGAVTRAAVVLLDAQTLTVIDAQVAKVATCMPYIPGVLSFRELPALLQASACCRRCLTWCSWMAMASRIRGGSASPRISAWSPVCPASASPRKH